MNRALTSNRASLTLIVIFVLTAWASPLLAQGDDEFGFGEDSKLNTNLGFVVTTPLNPTAQFAKLGYGFVAGAGYNLTKRNAFVGEFMWNWLGASDSALAPIRQVAQDSSITGHGNLYTITGNYRYELRGKTFGAYFIAGGGWYHRNAKLSKPVQTGTATICTPSWLYWGYTCTSGVVTSSQTIASSSSDALGVNGGFGFTIKTGEPRYRAYFEARYHYAPNKNVNTQLIPITIGIRF